MDIIYRAARPEDVAACIDIRGRTRENAFSAEQLAAAGVTLESWSAAVRDGSLPGHVATVGGRIAGYCYGDRETGEIVVLALLPEYEGRGAGKTLLNLVVRELQELGFKRLFLGCASDPKVRSYGFYRHLGWRSTGTFDDANDEVLEYFP
ncbi:GNAT family N-acetyltransferase [Achromobacter deleyi]|uniref:GNAT family N-acetyltransferase n=1 Tax=Achromobacter deleyi TaxID=1353891 RepID=UPI0014916664|nr:GNAT family N-acetyltransferase [Achromobacter deleyi]QVQ26440.1 GNAT family N-acetyltransferase [Achromobacter deleyi]UIP22009.1 GNAT family N-acetyltransferase [Achromobacter deleyi]